MAANKLLFWVLMLWCIRRSASEITGESRITLTPEKLVLAHDKVDEGGIVTVKCEAVNLGLDVELQFIYIQRTVQGDSKEEKLVQDGVENGFIEPTKPGMSVTGGLSDKQLTLRMEQTKCGDAGNYSCSVVLLRIPSDSDPVEIKRTSKSLEVEVSPGNISLIADPNYNSYTVNDTVTLKCNGPVGTVDEGTTQLAWVWEYRAGNFPESSWRAVDEKYAHVHNVEPPIKKNCYEMRQSWLVLNLTKEDTDRIYRCHIVRNSQPYIEFAATHTIGAVTEEEITTPRSDTDGESADKADVGMIIGIVVGVLVIIIVVIVIIVFVVRRKNASKEEDAHGPDYSTSKPDDDAPPFTTGPGVVYTQPSRFRNDRETGEDRDWERGRGVNAEGLHYADLDLVRTPPSNDSSESIASRTTSTEYASIRLY